MFMFKVISYSYTSLLYETPYVTSAAPTRDFFQLFLIVRQKVNTLAITLTFNKITSINQ